MSSLVVTTPGPTNTSSSITTPAVTYTLLWISTRSPMRTPNSTEDPRPTTEPEPITARSRT